MMRASASLPDGRDETARLSGACGPFQQVRREYGRQALGARHVNVVRSEARAGTPNLICRHGRSSDYSGILLKKDTAESAGDGNRGTSQLVLKAQTR